MVTIVWLFITVIVPVAGSKLEATEGENVSIHFETELERVDEVRVIFERENEGKVLVGQYCSLGAVLNCDFNLGPLQVEKGKVSLILLNVSSSHSGLYRAQVIMANEMSEPTVTLTVNKPSFSVSPAPVSSSTKPPKSIQPQEHQGLIAAIIFIINVIFFIVLGFCLYCKLRRMLCFRRRTGSEVVAVNGCRGNPDVLLPDTECLKTLDNVTNTCLNGQSKSIFVP